MNFFSLLNKERTKLGKLFFQRGLYTKNDFKKVISQCRKSKDNLIEVILGNVSPEQEDRALSALSEHYDLPVALLRNKVIVQPVLNLLPKEIAEQHRVIVFKKMGQAIGVATTAPENGQIFDFIRKKTGFEVSVYITTPKDIEYVLKRYDGKHGMGTHHLMGGNGGGAGTKNGKKEKAPSPQADILDRMTDMVSTTRVVNSIIERAITAGASDIHIESGFKKIFVRYRIDGILNKFNELPKAVMPAVVARIRILANLKIDEHAAPQDGRFHYKYNDQNIALRVSIIPTLHGPKVVMRVLEMKDKNMPLNKLGLNACHLEIVRKEMALTQGMLLVTGPTGSGKTTTLYTMLQLLNKEDVNISTIEDPIEYGIDNINQTQIAPRAGMTFASGLKSLLRQDPDILMVGEIRDTETAEIAANAALTGHLVLSTLHTNNAFLVPQRLIEMGIQPFIVSSVLKLAIGQRLVRKLCHFCRAKARAGDKVIGDYAQNIDFKAVFAKLKNRGLLPEFKSLDDVQFYHARGCRHCAGTGYQGRVGIYEIIRLDNDLRRHILSDSSEVSVKQSLEDRGVITMADDGMLKAFKGITTLDEVMRVTKE